MAVVMSAPDETQCNVDGYYNRYCKKNGECR